MVVPEVVERRVAAAGDPPAAARTGRAALASPWLAAVAVLTAAGIVIRALVAHQSLFGDELSTYWIVATHGLRGVLDLLYSTGPIHHAEITPPLYFVASWLTVQPGHAPELLRLPSLVAGALSIPAVYALGARTVGRRAGLLACALTALSPFMIYYSTEARAYAVMMLLVVVSTLALLAAIETRRTRWWVLYALASCASLYTHYTGGFVLAAQLCWALWAHPEARRPALLANVGVAVGLLPWLPGLIADFSSPTVTILSALSPFTAHDLPIILGHWALGYPYANSVALAHLPGPVALGLLAAATALAVVAGLARAGRRGWLADRRLVLVIALLLATPVGEAIVSLLSTHIFGVRNLAASWPALALVFAALLTASGRRLAPVGAALAVAAFGLAAARMLMPRFSRPDYRSAAAFVDRQARPGDVVVDETGDVSPGPLTPLDVALTRRVPIFRAGAPDERDHPFGFGDPIVPASRAVQQAAEAAGGARILIVSTRGIAALRPGSGPVSVAPPAPYRLVARRAYPGIATTEVDVYAERAG